jgi:hypothetical protein
MSVEDRLRAGFAADADLVAPRTEDALEDIRRRRRRGRAARWAGASIAAVATAAATVGVVALLPQVLPARGPELGGSPPTSLVGDYTVAVGAGPAAQREGMTGRWRVSLTSEGSLLIQPPAGFPGATSGTSYAVDGDELTTNALVDQPGCQAEPSGRYRWAMSGATLELTVVEDRCRARRILFGGTWSRVP